MIASIIGSGVAGLSSSIHLAKKGYSVHVFEKNATYGGKLSQIQLENYRFDAGPSLFTMPQYVTEMLDQEHLDKFEFEKLEILCNYFFTDGTTFNAPSNKESFLSLASDTFQEPENQIRKFLKKSEKTYEITAPVFLQSSLHKLKTYLSKTGSYGILILWRIDMFRTMNSAISYTFKNKNLIQIFNRYATYNGSDPFRAPATLNVIPHLEYHYGAFLPKEGMQSIAKILYEQALSLGVTFHFNSEVRSIYKSDNQLTHIELPNNKLFKSDIFIANCDAKLVYKKLLRTHVPQKIKKAENSSSALIFYWGIKKEFPELDVHNIFFTEDYKQEFNSIFQAKNCQNDPTIYINITSKKIKVDAPEGCENWFVMINTPCNEGQDWDRFRAEAKEKIISKLSKTLGCDIASLIEVEEYLDPVRIEQFTGSNKGSLYGSSSNHRMSAFFRQANFSSIYKNLYFCGGSVHPGGGIPLCLLSAKILSDIIPNANSRK